VDLTQYANKIKTVRIHENTWRKLMALKAALGLSDMEEVILFLLERFELLTTVRDKLCKEYAGSSGSPNAWERIFKKLGLSNAERAIALALLRPQNSESLILDPEVCKN
jgi:hypothetical protein